MFAFCPFRSKVALLCAVMTLSACSVLAASPTPRVSVTPLERGDSCDRCTSIEIPVAIPLTDIIGPGVGESVVSGLRECPSETITLSEANFDGGSFVLQAGFVEGEMAGVTYTVDPGAFPIRIDSMEMVFAQDSTVEGTVTEWSVIVFAGNPDTGQLVQQFSSDGNILPHITMPPGTAGVVVQLMVDPNDPEQIFVPNNGSNTFSVVFRVDSHNSPPTVPCDLGITPAECCPPDPARNAFPTTDTPEPNVPDFPTANWLYCKLGCGPLACPGGWHRFSDLGLFRPSGDWNIRATYTPTDCNIEGACCKDNGNCVLNFEDECIDLDGLFWGPGTECSPNPCPQPDGACCDELGVCTDDVPANNCDGPSLTHFPNETCIDITCPDPVGACCNSTGGCLDNLDQTFCEDTLGGIYAGAATQCEDDVCVAGACCMPDGSCNETVEAGCFASGGTFQGSGTLCSETNCPQPLGACCIGGNVCTAGQTQGNCESFDGYWGGPGTDCADLDENNRPDVCDVALCPYDLDENGSVGPGDVGIVKNFFGCDIGQSSCVALDFDNNGSVGPGDVGVVKNSFGACP